VVAFLSDPPETVIRNLKIYLPHAPIHVFPGFPPKEAKVHVALHLAQCLERAGIPIDPESSFKEALKSPLLGGRRPPGQETNILLHPGSGGRNKNHSVQFWLELIRELKEKIPPLSPSIRLGLLLGPAEELLYPVFRERLKDESVKITFLPRTEDLKPLLEKTALYIGHDSGLTHLAAMLGTATIALFKNTSVHQWRPLGPRVTVICKEEENQALLGRILYEIYARIGTWIDQEECRILLSNNPYGPNNRDN
jgi:ADP-heptose:LPS heptosyltransferase